MQYQLSPKDLASAIGVSDSSIKRWVDGGELRAHRTAGGHRRIDRAEAIRFVRARGVGLARPELLDLPQPLDVARLSIRDTTERLYTAFLDDNPEAVHSLIVSSYLSGVPLAELCDGPVREALRRVGELWLEDANGILIEHRAVDVCVEVLSTLRRLISVPATNAPRALGGAAGKDVYMLPSLMITLILTDAGFRASNLGPDTPCATTAATASRLRPELVWQTVSVPAACRGLQGLAEELAEQSIPLVVGGRALEDNPKRVPPGAVMMGSLTELAGYAQAMVAHARTSA